MNSGSTNEPEESAPQDLPASYSEASPEGPTHQHEGASTEATFRDNGSTGGGPGAPPLPAGHKRISLSAVAEAGHTLHSVGLGRVDATFDRWLLRKRCGLWVPAPGDSDPDRPAIVAPEDCVAYARDFLGVGPQLLSPFTLKGKGATLGSTWAIQTFFTQLQRPNKVEQTLFRQAEPVEAVQRDGPAPRGTRYRIPVISSEIYWSLLPTLLGGKRVPLEAVSIWRYRLEPLLDGTAVEDLIDRFLGEFKISQSEAEILFERSTAEETD